MTITLSGPYQLDRLSPIPAYYVVTERALRVDKSGKLWADMIVARSSNEGSFGHVSKQTPLGQGTYLNLDPSQLRRASKASVRKVLATDHPHGVDFRPRCPELDYNGSGILIGMKLGPMDWATPPQPEQVLVGDRSPDELRKITEAVKRRYSLMMRYWPQITGQQIQLVLASLR
jgi:hypothetical protein